MGRDQFVFVDTPGYQTRHGNALNRSLNRTAAATTSDVDLILFVVEAGKFTNGDVQLLELLKGKASVILIANKLDLLKRRSELAPWLASMQDRRDFLEYVPLSAKNAKDVQRLLQICAAHLPEQAWRYAEDELTDRSERFLATEMIREKLFRLTGDELPYSSTVLLDQFEEQAAGPGKKRFVKMAATIVVERDSHKAMVIGDGGERIKSIGTTARRELEHLLDAKVFLELWVKVRSGWADDEARLRSYGYE